VFTYKTKPREAFVLCGLAALAAVAGILLLGLPGALIYQGLALVAPHGAFRELRADSAWPAALLLSILWPWGLLLAYVLTPGRRTSGRGLTWQYLLFVEAVWSVGIALLMSALGG
jgi:hypothetical protein